MHTFPWGLAESKYIISYHRLCLGDVIQLINPSQIERVIHFEEKKKVSVIQTNLNYSIFASEKIATATISTKSRERTAKSIFAKRQNFLFCTKVISIEWVISIFMLAELKDQKLLATQKQIQKQRQARSKTVVLKIISGLLNWYDYPLPRRNPAG